MASLLEKIEDVWGGNSDFEKDDFKYVAFVISQDIAEMADEKWDEEESIEELADIALNSIRMLSKQDKEIEKILLERLENHDQKDTDELEEKYQTLFNEQQEKDEPIKIDF